MLARLAWTCALCLFPTALWAQTICLDPGHGGDDAGAVGCGLYEKDINLDTGLRLRDLLTGAGFTPLMTRDTDVFIPLAGRADYANANGADRFVSIHANANDGTPGTGTETFCANGASANSFDLRDKIQTEMIDAWGLADRGGKTANFTVLTATDMPATLTELGFVNNCGTDATYLSSPDHRQEAAAAHLRAIQLHYGQSPTDTGTARGAVFEELGSGTDDMSIRLTGAAITVVETGDSAIAEGEDALWVFTLPPGTYTLRASLAGYETNSRSCEVAANAVAWCSIGLLPEQVQPDAGVEDAGEEDAGGEDAGGEDAGGVDAGEEDAGTPDAGEVDAGGGDEEPGMTPDEGGCGCSASGGSSQGLAVLLLASVLVLSLGRRRLAAGLLVMGLLSAVPARAGELRMREAKLLLSGDVQSALLSPDGQQLLLSAPGLERIYLWRLDRPADKPELLARGPRVGFAPRWGADSRRVALRDSRQPFAAAPGWVDLRGEQQGRAYGDWLLRVEQADDAIWLISPAGRQRMDPGGDRFFAPRLSPQGRYLVFEGLRTGLYLMRLSDGEIFSLGSGHHPDFGGADDSLLVYDVSEDDGHRLTAGELHLCRLDGAEPACSCLTGDSPAIEQHPSLSADGAKLVYVTQKGQVWMATLRP